MKKKRYSSEQIVGILQEAERNECTIGEVCRKHGVSEAAFYRWRKMYGNMQVSEVKRLRELEQENGRLKRLLAERDLEIDVIKEVLAKKW
jgi:putative transposase